MFCDYHIHSTCSGDGLSSMQEQIQASLDKGVGKLCFTEHVDIGIVGDKFDTDLDLYARTFEEAKRAFPKLPLFMGLELGYVRKDVPGLQARCARLPLDFHLLSIHLVNGIDPFDVDIFFNNKSREQAAVEYLQAVLESVREYPDYDAVAHIGYVFKFTGDRFPPLRYEDAPELMDEILKTIIQRGKALELNTSRWNGQGMPGQDVFRRYKELGGELVTLGSDSHRVNSVANGFAQATEQLKSLGFGYLATYEKRRLVMEKL